MKNHSLHWALLVSFFLLQVIGAPKASAENQKVIITKNDSHFFYSFKEFQDQVLYHPEWGYYGSGRVNFGKVGTDGDFATYPTILSPFFGQMLVEHAYQMWLGMKQSGALLETEKFSIIEYGGGNGDLAFDFMSFVTQEVPPNADPRYWQQFLKQFRYILIDRSPKLLEQQREKTQPFASKVQVIEGDARDPLATFAPNSIKGLVFSNELLDVFGSHKIIFSPEGTPQVAYVLPYLDEPSLAQLHQSGVPAELTQQIKVNNKSYLTRERFEALLTHFSTRSNEEYQKLLQTISFDEAYLPASYFPEVVDQIEKNIKEYAYQLIESNEEIITYLNVDANRYLQGVAQVLVAGYIVTIDYGYNTASLFERIKRGKKVLRTYPDKQDPNQPSNPYHNVTLNDITLDQDFTLLSLIGADAGLNLIHYGPHGHLVSGTSVPLHRIELDQFRHRPSKVKVLSFLIHTADFKILVQQKKGTDPYYQFGEHPSMRLYTYPHRLSANQRARVLEMEVKLLDRLHD